MPAVLGRDGNRDALPTVLLEAIASGIPVIGSRLTGIPEIVDHGENGLLIEPGDVAGLANAIATLLDDSKLRRRYGRAARDKAERRFDVETNVGQLYELLTTRVHAPRDRDPDEIRVPVM
jgi:glycosyltransferase involved in cell wall biosynthesis